MSQNRSPLDVARQTDANQKPAKSRDVHIGHGSTLYGWTTDGREGWRLIGGGMTTDYMTAVRHAVEVDRLITRATAH